MTEDPFKRGKRGQKWGKPEDVAEAEAARRGPDSDDLPRGSEQRRAPPPQEGKPVPLGASQPETGYAKALSAADALYFELTDYVSAQGLRPWEMKAITKAHKAYAALKEKIKQMPKESPEMQDVLEKDIKRLEEELTSTLRDGVRDEVARKTAANPPAPAAPEVSAAEPVIEPASEREEAWPLDPGLSDPHVSEGTRAEYQAKLQQLIDPYSAWIQRLESEQPANTVPPKAAETAPARAAPDAYAEQVRELAERFGPEMVAGNTLGPPLEAKPQPEAATLPETPLTPEQEKRIEAAEAHLGIRGRSLTGALRRLGADLLGDARSVGRAAAHPVETARALHERAEKAWRFLAEDDRSLGEKLEAMARGYHAWSPRHKIYLSLALVGASAGVSGALPPLAYVFEGAFMGQRALVGGGLYFKKKDDLEARAAKGSTFFMGGSERARALRAGTASTAWVVGTMLAGHEAIQGIEWLGHLLGHGAPEAAVQAAGDHAQPGDIRINLHPDRVYGSLESVGPQHTLTIDSSQVPVEVAPQGLEAPLPADHLAAHAGAAHAGAVPAPTEAAHAAAPSPEAPLVPEAHHAAPAQAPAQAEAPAPPVEPAPAHESPSPDAVLNRQELARIEANPPPASGHESIAPPLENQGSVGEHPLPPQAEPATPDQIVRNPFGLAVIENHPHIYADAQSQLYVYGGSFQGQMNTLYAYLQEHPHATVTATDPSGQWRLPFQLDAHGRPALGQASHRSLGWLRRFFGGGKGVINPDGFRRMVV